MQVKFAYETRTVKGDGFVPRALRENESVFALANGFIGLRGNLVHVYQSAGRDGRRIIVAKGLTGEGYEVTPSGTARMTSSRSSIDKNAPGP